MADYKSQLSSLKAAEAIEQEKKSKQHKITIGASVAAIVLSAAFIVSGFIAGSDELPTATQSYLPSPSPAIETVVPENNDGSLAETELVDNLEVPASEGEKLNPQRKAVRRSR